MTPGHNRPDPMVVVNAIETLRASDSLAVQAAGSILTAEVLRAQESETWLAQEVSDLREALAKAKAERGLRLVK